MAQWLRQSPLDMSGQCRDETWVHRDAGGEESLPVQVRLGKPLDILNLKQNMLEQFDAQAAAVRASRRKLFSDPARLENVQCCPICECRRSEPRLSFYGAHYHECSGCSHHFVVNRPTAAEIEAFYAEGESYQTTYADKRTAEARVQQVALPKAHWTLEQFERLYGRRPRSVLDVGAGCGHFVQACRQLDIPADGLEISPAGRRACKELFGFEMSGDDFITQWPDWSDCEVVTFWGVIEHVVDPAAMLDAASRVLADREGMVVAEVPRWDCLATAVQSAYPDSIVRHLEPVGHINCFTDASLATALRRASFDVVAAWYFGMDAYELAMQVSHAVGNPEIVGEIAKAIPVLQQRLDLAMLSDEMVFAGRPRRGHGAG